VFISLLVPESKFMLRLDVDMDMHADGLPNTVREPLPPFGPPIAPLAVAHPPEVVGGGLCMIKLVDACCLVLPATLAELLQELALTILGLYDRIGTAIVATVIAIIKTILSNKWNIVLFYKNIATI
jgi:hypothetical protein